MLCFGAEYDSLYYGIVHPMFAVSESFDGSTISGLPGLVMPFFPNYVGSIKIRFNATPSIHFSHPSDHRNPAPGSLAWALYSCVVVIVNASLN